VGGLTNKEILIPASIIWQLAVGSWTLMEAGMQGETTTVRSINAANKPVSLGEVFL